MAATTVRVLAYGCEHAPFTPKRHIEWLLARIEEWKPQIVVHLGDRLEAVLRKEGFVIERQPHRDLGYLFGSRPV
jgi:hypothetical protein